MRVRSHEPVVGGLGMGWLNRPHCNGTLKGATWGVREIVFSQLCLRTHARFLFYAHLRR